MLAEDLMAGKQGSIVALAPATGEVLCMVSASQGADSVNRAIGVEYLPGSTFKTAQALALFTEGVVDSATVYRCRDGFWRKNIHIGCHPHRSPLSLEAALGHSCNSYFCQAFANSIDNKTLYKTRTQSVNRWYEHMIGLGLGKPLGIDLPGEKGGLMPNADVLNEMHNGRWNGTTVMWVGMGQGEVRVTTLQLANLAAVIANRGYYIPPHIHRATAAHKLDERFSRKQVAPASAKAFEHVVRGMRMAVTRGTCTGINTKAFTICGKTGTAENAGPDHSIFIGFAPMNNPVIALAVYVEHGGFGADVAAPIAALLMEQAVKGKLSPASQSRAEKLEALNIAPLSPEKNTASHRTKKSEGGETALLSTTDSNKHNKTTL